MQHARHGRESQFYLQKLLLLEETKFSALGNFSSIVIAAMTIEEKFPKHFSHCRDKPHQWHLINGCYLQGNSLSEIGCLYVVVGMGVGGRQI